MNRPTSFNLPRRYVYIFLGTAVVMLTLIGQVMGLLPGMWLWHPFVAKSSQYQDPPVASLCDQTNEETQEDTETAPLGLARTDFAPPTSSGNSEVETVVVTIDVAGQGTTSPPPGTYKLPRYMPDGSGKYNEITISATPAEDYVFSRWTGAVRNVRTPQVVLSLMCNDDITAEFEYRPGFAALDLVADLGVLLNTLGFLEHPSHVLTEEIDLGGLPKETPSGIEYRGNGIPDVAEFAALFEFIKDPSISYCDKGGTSSHFAWRYYAQSLEQARKDLPHAAPEVQRAVAAYMALGYFGIQKTIRLLVADKLGVEIDTAKYPTLLSDALWQEGNADVDGAFNIEEWEACDVDPSLSIGDKAALYARRAVRENNPREWPDSLSNNKPAE